MLPRSIVPLVWIISAKGQPPLSKKFSFFPKITLFLLSLTILEPPKAEPLVSLEDATRRLGIDFRHQTGATGEFFFPEITGSGAGLVDFDGDGDLDAYLVQSGPLTAPDRRPTDRLYRNELIPEGKLRFRDVTAETGVSMTGYGMGVAAGDYDNDGRIDLYLTNFGANVLLINDGGGRFSDRTAASGTDVPDWSTSATFFDFNRDGWLDLFVANYVKFSVTENPACFAPSSRRDYCGPSSFSGVRDRLFLNSGDGTFRDVTLAMLDDRDPGPGLGVAAADLDGDGWQDLYVANDGTHNRLWLNRGGERFVDDALFVGVAVNGLGVAEASMGVAIGDFDEDDDEDIFLTHLAGETNTLYLNDGSGGFSDATARHGLAAPSRAYTGWGTAWVDLDGDAWLDLIVFNGAVRVIEQQSQRGDAYPFTETNQAFLNSAGKRFEDVSKRLGPALLVRESSRGAAFGDVDNDGDTDMLVNNGNGPAQLLLNHADPGSWIGVRLVDSTGRDQLGAVAVLALDSGRRLRRRATADGSYGSASDPRVLFALPAGLKPGKLYVRWPDGSATEHAPPPTGRYTTLVKS